MPYTFAPSFLGTEFKGGNKKKEVSVGGGKECMYIKGLVQTNIPPISNLTAS